MTRYRNEPSDLTKTDLVAAAWDRRTREEQANRGSAQATPAPPTPNASSGAAAAAGGSTQAPPAAPEVGPRDRGHAHFPSS